MTSRKVRAQIAEQTLEILERGWYENPRGDRVDLTAPMSYASGNTRLYRPDDFGPVEKCKEEKLRELDNPAPTTFTVTNETTLSAAQRLTADGSNWLALNFASAKNPGGGFLGGSQAQEESLARSSGLYPCINAQQEMYQHNRKFTNALYSDYMIYSPRVPVVRDDDGDLLAQPYELSFLTVPAVNKGALQKNHPRKRDRVEPTMRQRMKRLLSVAVANEHRNIILGAWGCGVFRNDPADVAEWFALELGLFQGGFDRVVFAIIDPSSQRSFIGPFEEVFPTHS